MDSLMAVKGKGFVVMAADGQVARSILVYQNAIDKIRLIDSHKIMAVAGPRSDSNTFGEFIEKNMTLYALENEVPLTTKATANFVRHELAKALRKAPFQVDILLGGVDNDEAMLYWLDYLGTLHNVNYGSKGHGASFTLSIMDKNYKDGLNKEEAVTIIKQCIKELQTRFLISYPNFYIKVVTSEGVEVLEAPNPEASTTN
eukprot:268719_1